MAIFGIGDKRVRVVLEKLTAGKTAMADKRGTNARVSKFSEEKGDLVREHNKKLPTMTSRYSRAKYRNLANTCSTSELTANNEKHKQRVCEQAHLGEMQREFDAHKGRAEVTDEPGTSRGRKRKPQPETWKMNIAKKLRNEGKAYISRKTHKEVEARKIGPACADGCFEKVTMPVIEALFKEYWGMGDYNAQTSYLQKSMVSVPVKRHRVPAEGSSRTQTALYSVTYGDKRYKVCKKAFMAIFGIGDKRVRVVLKKLTDWKTAMADKRGTNARVSKYSGEKGDFVREHIKKLPTMTSRYSRAKSPNRVYMESNLSVVKLYDMYVKFMKEEHPNVDIVSINFYSNVFRTEFNNIGFVPPVVDMCNTCDLLTASIEKYERVGCEQAQFEEMQREFRELDAHKVLATHARTVLYSFSSSDSDDFMALCFNLRQALPTPKLSTSVAFYKRKLWTYNFCVFNLKTQKSTMYIWDEVTARRGSCEIMSCVNHYIEANHVARQKKLVLFSDNCARQNKNIIMILGCLRLMHSKRFARIEHYFMVSGHAYMPCDHQFGYIEVRLRRESTISSKYEYMELIRNAVREGFHVVEMTQNDFLNFELLQSRITNRTSKTTSLQDARVIVYDCRYGEGYAIKNNYDVADTSDNHQVRLMKGRGKYSQMAFDLSEVTLPPRYTTPIPLSKEKLQDIKDLVLYVTPLESAQYFRDIIDKQDGGRLDDTPEEEEEEEEEVPVRGADIDALDTLLEYQ
ncbi:uncharacterized protein LOC135200853 [Macrobrachium nipponense]|uniref:uncharacterized protein LOC135200853 n=1 Tax=Macrobrachium nipponense TaxID=159736 RepID=UPI0030C8AB53